MTADNKFISGLIVKAPNANAPEYIKARLSIRREELIAWLQSESGEWINADIKVSQGGKWYCQIDDWKPEGRQAQRAPARTPQRAATGSRPQQSPADPFHEDDPPF